MEKTYWLGRKRATLRLAREATSSDAGLIYYDLARRYGLKALTAEMRVGERADKLPPRPLGFVAAEIGDA